MADSTQKNSVEVIKDELVTRPDRRDFLRNTLVFTPMALLTAYGSTQAVSALAETPEPVYAPTYFTEQELILVSLQELPANY